MCWRAQRAKILPKCTAVLYGARSARKFCQNMRHDRQQPGPPATTEGAVTRPATLPLAAHTTVDPSLVTRAPVLHLMPCSQLGSWYLRHAQCTQWLSITRRAACSPLHSSMCVAPSFLLCAFDGLVSHTVHSPVECKQNARDRGTEQVRCIHRRLWR